MIWNIFTQYAEDKRRMRKSILTLAETVGKDVRELKDRVASLEKEGAALSDRLATLEQRK